MNFIDKVNPKHTALIVIDIQNDFASPAGRLGELGRDFSMVPPMLEKLDKTISAAKSKNIPVLYTQQIYDRSKLTARQLEQYDLDGKLVTCDIDTEGYKFYKIEADDEMTFVKYNFDTFSNPELCQFLDDKNIKTLIITGMDTIYCVETAVRRAFDLGFKIVMPRDLIACNAKNYNLHDHTIKMVAKGFGVTPTAAELIEAWQSY